VHIPPAYGLGAMRALFGLVDAFAPARWWMIGFEHGPYEPMEFKRETQESGTSAPGRKVVTCVPAPENEHDVTVALPGLAADPSVLARVVVAPYSPNRRGSPRRTPKDSTPASASTVPAQGPVSGRRSIRDALRPGPIQTGATNASPEPPDVHSSTTPSTTLHSRCLTRTLSTTQSRHSRRKGARALPDPLLPTIRTVLRNADGRHPY
jgi:hypothetical protein